MSDLFNIAAKVRLDISDFDANMDHIELRVDKALQALADFAASSVKNYASYEQLAGGVNALFGDAAGTVLGNASTASGRMGMSENDYLSNAIKYSAALLKDLGGDANEAARLVDLALTDMNDNAMRFGTSISMIQTAYNGFARESFRSLGNLYLGYGNSKASMEELMADAEAITGMTYDMERFADVIEAIHVIQDQIGVTGTAQLEVGTTIEGSVNAMKAAYSDFKTAFVADNMEATESLDTLIGSVAVAMENITPRIGAAMDSIVSIFETGALRVSNAIGRAFGGAGGNYSTEMSRMLYDAILDEGNRRGYDVTGSDWLMGRRYGAG